MNTCCLVVCVYVLLYTYIYKTTNTFSCIRHRHISEIGFATWQDNDAYLVANSQKSFRKCFIRCQKTIGLVIHFTCLSERLIERLHIFPMKDYNMLIFSSTLQRHSSQGCGFLRFLRSIYRSFGSSRFLFLGHGFSL